jgi:hypothetical protein
MIVEYKEVTNFKFDHEQEVNSFILLSQGETL